MTLRPPIKGRIPPINGIATLEVEEQAPLRHQRILQADLDGTAAAASEENYAAWKAAREALLAQASYPSMSVRTVTSLTRAAAPEASAAKAGGQALTGPDIIVEMVEREDRERPSGRRFGALVHALLASIDLDAGVDAIKAGAAINGRLVDATEEEVQAAIGQNFRQLSTTISQVSNRTRMLEAHQL